MLVKDIKLSRFLNSYKSIMKRMLRKFKKSYKRRGIILKAITSKKEY